MSEPKRYMSDCYLNPGNNGYSCVLRQHAAGDFVRDEDYARLKAEFEKFKFTLEEERQIFRQDCEKLQAQVERMTKAGNNLVYVASEHPVSEPFVKAWFAAKDGKDAQ